MNTNRNTVTFYKNTECTWTVSCTLQQQKDYKSESTSVTDSLFKANNIAPLVLWNCLPCLPILREYIK